ncbi:TrbI/VirB10 family protein [Erythrobacter sp. F6033]|uniref:TrbI/VirB10 family protein n=1 Tax=Erythrobacter sp. F6033 TaxID=2926401 RepID=UPI001FF32FCE|nr:TrbI/VirB10 family protein [Erythrobacter sp. F6033]MCK0127542.1 conjugal transfer protein TrbI [Erythrobacter sp. F6033]
MSKDTADALGEAGQSHDIRPMVTTGGSANWSLWLFLGLLAIAGAWLFNALSAAREAANAPEMLQSAAPSNTRISAPDSLQIPNRFSDAPAPTNTAEPIQPLVPASRSEPLVPATSERILPPPVSRFPFPQQLPPPPLPAPQVVFENRGPVQSDTNVQNESTDGERVTAARLLNPARTIPQGTVIPAVLETALDSTRPGGARALVQRNVYSFDGTRVLIPRGSRLYGEYEAGLQRGQNRALVQWTRLIRPDGVTIALDSPSSDPLGRAGIKGKVDGKFFQRFGNAILQSVLDVGVGLAVNQASDGVIVALPGSTQNVQVSDSGRIQPTLKVKHGTSVSVFVARDLDFSSVDP